MQESRGRREEYKEMSDLYDYMKDVYSSSY